MRILIAAVAASFMVLTQSGAWAAMRVATGVYVGNGTGQTISGVGFQPDFVIIKGDGADPAIVHTSTMTGDVSKELGTNRALFAQAITSLNSDGFTVGSDAAVNQSGRSNYWVAFKAAPGQMTTGSYVGDHQNNRSIGGIGFRPAYVIVFAEAGQQAMQRFADEAVGKSLEFDASDQKDHRIQDFQPDGFQIGDHNTVNQQDVIYHYLAWDSVSGNISTASYIGDGVQNRYQKGVGFWSDAVIIKHSGGESSVFRLASFLSDSSLFLDAHGRLAGGIQAFKHDGFQIGTNKAVNENSKTIYWVAFKDGLSVEPSADLSLSKSVNNNPAHVLDTVTYTVVVTNQGPDSASGVTIEEVLPSGLEYISHAVSEGGYVPSTGAWTLGSLQQLGSATLTVTSRINLGTVGSTIANYAAITSLDQADPDTTNNHAGVVITVLDRAPVLTPIGPKTLSVGQTLVFDVFASDPDSTIPSLVAQGVPANASFQDNGNGTGTFQFTPNLLQIGFHTVRFIASDGQMADSENVLITVLVINRAPVLSPIGAKTVNEGQHLEFIASATDPEGTTPMLTCSGLPLHAGFTDNGNGSGRFTFDPDYSQSGLYSVRVMASDGALADTELVSITVINVNRAPVLNPIGARSVAEAQNLSFTVVASDPDGTIPDLTVTGLPINASFADLGNGTGTFQFNPDFTQSGIYTLRFVASDGFLADTETVAITVLNVNRPPILDPIGSKSAAKGGSLLFTVQATDPDSSTPSLQAGPLPLHATFSDQGNGTGVFQFNPDMSQVGIYFVTFIASDDVLADSESVRIAVTDVNLPPVIDPVRDTSVVEGQTLTLLLTAHDPEGTAPIWTVVGLPANATFVTLVDGRGEFQFSPSFVQAANYTVLFIVGDGSLADTAQVVITVIEAGNQRPVLTVSGSHTVQQGDTLRLSLSGTDPDGTVPALGVFTPPANASLVDHHDGLGDFVFTPSPTQLGDFQFRFTASDGLLADTEAVTVNVVASRPARIVVSPDSVVVSADSTQLFTVVAYDGLGNPADAGSISWVLTSPLGTIGATGLFDAVVAGQARVVAISSFGLVDTTRWLQVTPGRAVALRVIPDSLDLIIGDSTRYEAEGVDRRGNVADAGPLRWGVVGTVGSIDAAGLFIAITPGTGRIWASSQTGGLTDTSRVLHVVNSSLNRLVVQPDTASLRISDSRVFTATGFNQRLEPADVGVLSWSVAGDIGRIDVNGRFVATKPGLGYIVATSNINGVSDSSDMIVVDVSTVSEIPLGNAYVSAGQSMVPVLAFNVQNRFATPRSISAITVRNASHGAGLTEQIRGNVSSISLYQDSDHNGRLTSNDALVGNAPFSADSVLFVFSPVVVTPGSNLSFFAAITVGSSPHDGDSLDLFLRPQTDLRTTDGSIVAGSATINSLGYDIVDGLVAQQIRLTPPLIDSIAPLSYTYQVLAIDLPRNGYMVDTLKILTLANHGTATELDIDSMILYSEDADGVWNGPGSEERIGPLEFTGKLWSISGLNVPLTGPVRRFQIGVKPSRFAQSGATIALGIPLHGIEMASDNDGPIDAAVPAVDTVVIVANQAVTVTDIPLSSRSLIPGTNSGPILSVSLVNNTGAVATLDSLRLALFASDPGSASQTQLDSQIDMVRLWLDRDGDSSSLGASDTMIASGILRSGSSLLATPALSISGSGGRINLTVTMDVSRWSSKNGNKINCGIASAENLFFHGQVPIAGGFPLRNGGDFTIDAFPASNVTVDTTADATLFEGQRDRVVFQFRLPRNGYSQDALRSLRITGEGAVDGRTAFTAMRLWEDRDTNGLGGSDTYVGALTYQNGAWSISGLSHPLRSITTAFLLAADVSASIPDGGTLQLSIPVDGVTYGSGTDGPDDHPIQNPVTFMVFPANRVTAISIPSASTTIIPGSAHNVIFSFALYNGYAGTSKILRGITLTNTSRSRSSASFADHELGQVSLFTDDNADRIFNEATPITTGYFTDGRMKLSGMAQVLSPESLNYFFVVADVPRDQIDADSLSLAISGTSDFEFSEPTSVNGDIPVDGGSYRVVDGSVAVQYDLIDLSSTTIQPGDTAVPVFGFRPAANGDQADTLRRLVIGNLGSAGSGDITALRLCLDRDGDSTYSRADSTLGWFHPVGTDWQLDLAGLEVRSSPPVLLVVANVAGTATPGSTVRLVLPINGCTYASANDGPHDRALASAGTYTITGAALRVSPSTPRKSYSVGQAVRLDIDVFNTLSTTLANVVPEVAEILDSATLSLDSSDVAPRTLGPGETAHFHYYYTAMRPGHPIWRLRAKALGQADSSATVETSPITIKAVPSLVGIKFINSMPTAAIRGQSNVFPLSILVSHNDTSALASSLRLDSLRINVEDESGNPIAMTDVATRLVLSAGYTDISIIEHVPDESSVLFAFNQPVIVPPGESRLMTLLVDISDSAKVQSFSLGLEDEKSLVPADENTLLPVSYQTETPFPWRTANCRIYQPARTVAISGIGLQKEIADYGQSDVPVLRVAARDPDLLGSSQVQLSRVTCLFMDAAGVPIAPGDVANRVSLVARGLVVGEVTALPSIPDAVDIALQAPVTLSVGQSESIELLISIRPDAVRNEFEVQITDSTAFTFRDLSSGSLLKAISDPLVIQQESIFPIRSGVVTLKQPAEPPAICLSSALPPAVIGGADSIPLVKLSLSYPITADHAPILVRNVLISALDSTGRVLDPYRLFDRVGYRIDGGSPVYLSYFALAQGAIQFAFGDHGLQMNPGDSLNVELIADINADVPFDYFLVSMRKDGALDIVDAANTSVHLGASVATECLGTLPYVTPATRIFLPAGSPRLTTQLTQPQIAYAGQTGVTVFRGRLVYTPRTSQGNLTMSSLRGHLYRRLPTGLQAVAVDTVLDSAELEIAGRKYAATSLQGDDLSFLFDPGLVIKHGDDLELTIVANIRSSAPSGNYVLQVLDSSFIGLTDEQLGTPIAPILATGGYPAVLGELSVTAPDLGGSFTNFPNPFNPAIGEVTTIGFVLNDPAVVDLAIYTITGEKVKSILQGVARPEGSHQTDVWDGLNGAGQMVLPGTYYCRINVRYESGGSEQLKRKVAVVR